MERVLIQSIDHYDIADEKTGEVNLIDQVYYMTQYRDASKLNAGSKPMKVGCLCDLGKKMIEDLSGCSIGIFDVEFSTRPGAGGKPALTMVVANLVKRIDLKQLLIVPTVKAA